MSKTEELIIKHEGYRKYPYMDTKGNNTVGYGFNLDAGMTEPEARVLLNYKVDLIRDELNYKFQFFNSLSANRQDVLIDMVYNLGLTRFLKFEKMLAAIEEGNFARAKMELLDSDAARELHNRYGELGELMIKG
jgi:lysozyme